MSARFFPGLLFSFVRAALERWLLEGFISQILNIAFLGVSTKCPGCSTKCFHHDFLELKCLPGPCGPWLLFSSQHPGGCSFPGNFLWLSLVESHFVHTQVSIWPKIQGDSDADLGSTSLHSSFFSGAVPHKFQPPQWLCDSLSVLQLSETITPCVDYVSLFSLKVFPGKKLEWSCGSPHLSPFLSQLSSVYFVVQHLKTVTSHIFFRFIVVYWGRTSPVAFTLLLARCMYLICILRV